MSCGRKIRPFYDDWSAREDLAHKLEREGEYDIADAVRNDTCLDERSVRDAEDALERQGLFRDLDFTEDPC